MKTGILYASKTGTTRKCAYELQRRLSNAELIDLTEKSPDLSVYDLLIIGSSVRFGQIHSKVKKLIKENQNVLNDKPYAIFICQGLPEYKAIIDKNFPSTIREKAVDIVSFKGEVDIERQKGLDRFIVKLITKDPKFVKPQIDYNAIDKFANKIKKYMEK